MAIELKFSCNICGEEFITQDAKVKIPLGWGVVRPVLRVKMPSFPDKKRDREKYWEFDKLKTKLKNQLAINEYHICHNCLLLSQDKILKIEQGKKRKGCL